MLMKLTPASTGAEGTVVLTCKDCGRTAKYCMAEATGWRAIAGRAWTYVCGVCLERK
jgi:hypothetical protein